jgi:hypothetical protein
VTLREVPRGGVEIRQDASITLAEALDGEGPAVFTPPELTDWPGHGEDTGTTARRLDLDRLEACVVAEQQAGERLLMSGALLTGRDAAHRRMAERLAGDTGRSGGRNPPCAWGVGERTRAMQGALRLMGGSAEVSRHGMLACTHASIGSALESPCCSKQMQVSPPSGTLAP